MIEGEAAQFIVSYLEQYGSERGAFKLDKGDGNNQQLPGVSVPAWLISTMNMLSGHPALPFNNDRPSLHRDILFLGCAALCNVLARYNEGDEQVRFSMHILRQEEALRREMFVEEAQNAFIEDLAFVSSILLLKLNVGAKQAIYETLERLFHYVQNIDDVIFWRPTVLQMMLKIPEISLSMRALAEDPFYKYDSKFEAWAHMLSSQEEED